MNRLGTLIILGGALFIVEPAIAQSEGDGSVIAFPADGIGKKCEILLKNKDPGSVVTNVGEMVRLDHEFVVLRNATRASRVDVIVPIVGHLPFVGRLFRYTAVGSEEVRGELKVRRTEVASVQIAE